MIYKMDTAVYQSTDYHNSVSEATIYMYGEAESLDPTDYNPWLLQQSWDQWWPTLPSARSVPVPPSVPRTASSRNSVESHMSKVEQVLEAGKSKFKAQKLNRFQHLQGGTVYKRTLHPSCVDETTTSRASVVTGPPPALIVSAGASSDKKLANIQEHLVQGQQSRQPPLQQCDDEPLPAVHAVHIPFDDEEEYTEVFQKYLAVQVSLNRNISQALRQVFGVESVSVGFSTERDGYWPVIRVVADEETCEEIKRDKRRKMTLIGGVTTALQGALTKLHPSTSWNEEELKNTIEIVMNYPLEEYELCSAGDVVETSYCDNRGNRVETKQGTLGYTVCHKIQLGNDYVDTNHYEITGFHVVIPGRSKEFKQALDPLPSETTAWKTPDEATTAKYKCIDKSPDSSTPRVKETRQKEASTCLRATIFTQQAKNSFQRMQRNHGYKSSIQHSAQAVSSPTLEQAELVVGKFGLVKHLMTNIEDEECSYEYSIVKNPQNGYQSNIDVAVLKFTDYSDCHESSIQQSFHELQAGEGVTLPQSITWSGPPSVSGIEKQKGKVVYIASGMVYYLADKLVTFADNPPQPDCYPGYIWKRSAHVTVPPGHSGAPVFLLNGSTFYLLGNLITAASASPAMYSLNMVHDEIAIDHIEKILKDKQEYTTQAVSPGTTMESESLGTPDMQIRKRLKKYKEYLKWHSKEQSLTSLIEERYIRCELTLCISDPSHDHCY